MKYTELKDKLSADLTKAYAEYEAAKMDVSKLEALQGVSNLLTLLTQVENLIAAEKVNSQ